MDVFERADRIEAIVQNKYLDPNYDAADMAVHEIAIDPNRTDEEIARQVAMAIAQP